MMLTESENELLSRTSGH